MLVLQCFSRILDFQTYLLKCLQASYKMFRICFKIISDGCSWEHSSFVKNPWVWSPVLHESGCDSVHLESSIQQTEARVILSDISRKCYMRPPPQFFFFLRSSKLFLCVSGLFHFFHSSFKFHLYCSMHLDFQFFLEMNNIPLYEYATLDQECSMPQVQSQLHKPKLKKENPTWILHICLPIHSLTDICVVSLFWLLCRMFL